MMILWTCSILFLTSVVLGEVSDLEGYPDFHEVTLRWRAPPSDFNISFCELQSWGLSHCRNKFVENPLMNELDMKKATNGKKIIYATKITSLRMATNYTFRITPDTYQNRRERKMKSEIQLQTKEFSVQPNKCTGDTSEVEVLTGPNFGGKISVEGLKDEMGKKCSVYGKADSKNSKYLLKINYKDCKSIREDGAVSTFIIVQENLTILTHSTKRFIIICNYTLPESYTVKAGVSMPNSQREVVSSSIHEVDAEAPNLNLKNIITLESLNSERQSYSAAKVVDDSQEKTKVAHMVLMIILVVAAVIGCAAAVWWFFTSHRRQHTRGFMSPQSEPRTLVYDNIENFVREQCANSNNVPVDPSVELIGVRQIQPPAPPE